MREQNHSSSKISRRKLLMSLGITGVALATGNEIFESASNVSAQSVTGSVYGTGAAAATVSTYPVYNVRDFGAMGDGTADDRAAIQSALDQAKLGEYSQVVIPKGTYKLTNSLRIYRNTRLTLEQGATMLRYNNNSMLLNGDNGVSFQGYEGNGNIIIEGRKYTSVSGYL